MNDSIDMTEHFKLEVLPAENGLCFVVCVELEDVHGTGGVERVLCDLSSVEVLQEEGVECDREDVFLVLIAYGDLEGSELESNHLQEVDDCLDDIDLL